MAPSTKYNQFVHVYNVIIIGYNWLFLLSVVLESLKMPVSYGVLAAVIACLISVLLGLGVSHCCFSKNPLHRPRPRNKLIDLEMD